MSNVSGVGSSPYDNYNNKSNKNINLDEITTIFTTEKKEDKRTTFDETFTERALDDKKAKQGKKFLEGLKNNKDSLAADLGLTSEQYDALACIALGLASQETGMGLEDGYKAENTSVNPVKWARDIAKKVGSALGKTGSASSGLTQMKIYDFMQKGSLSDNEISILEKYGIKASSVTSNNLYKNPDKAAVATMVVLKNISEDYDVYKQKILDAHKKAGEKVEPELTSGQAIVKGCQLLSDITHAYNDMPNDKQNEVRQTLKQWFLSGDGSTKKSPYIKNEDGSKGSKVSNEYNEEVQLEKLNNLLKDSGITLTSQSLDILRVALTSDGYEMNITEFCAYAWNKGFGSDGQKTDRMLAERIGTLLTNPEDFDYDQFTSNVENLTEKYARQSDPSVSIDVINAYLEDSLD
ncbi:hypothetical protein II906_02060 [bacterium]|nr:hypothetical protein [bacterium]